jgi:hypothetical protein
MKCFEIQTYKDAAWHIDSVFDDADIALLEARRMDESRRYQIVRVVEETYDEASGATSCRVIFRGGRLAAEAKARRAAPAPPRPAAAPPASVGREPAHRGGRAPAAPQSQGLALPLAIGALIVVGGGAALFALHHLSRMQ